MEKQRLKQKQRYKGNQAYIANNLETTLVAQIIKLELRRSYKLYPANMDMIIEQIKALLDNPMPKIVIRADIKHFFESIPQQELIDKLGDDGYISRQTVKYLKTMLYTFNEKVMSLMGWDYLEVWRSPHICQSCICNLLMKR